MLKIIYGLSMIVGGGFLPLFFKKGNTNGDRLAVASVIGGELLIIPQTVIALLNQTGNNLTLRFYGLELGMDPLSALFLLMISVISPIIAVYAVEYLRQYRENGSDTRVNLLFFNLLIASMSLLPLVRESVSFLTVWEIMSLTSFLLVIFHHEQQEVRKAGIKYFVTMHIGFLCLVGGFLGASIYSGSTFFSKISATFATPHSAALSLTILLLIGFAFKAGFLPFHFWLPDAHPAAPTHVSALMSGVMIKTGIYGILRTLTLFQVQPFELGLVIMGIGAASGIYGIIYALSQRDLKKLLAYSSVENIGIIGIGIGVGLLGKASGNQMMAVLGFTGALLHTVNHSIFKSLLFSGAGIVYQKTHTRDLEQLGGLIKTLPLTAIGFFVGAAAICGLPPLNGFLGEFLIYLSLFSGLQNNSLAIIIPAIVAIIALVTIGGLAIACFTKAFGMVFLGSPRGKTTHPKGEPILMAIPVLILAVLTLVIGLCPLAFVKLFSTPVAYLSGVKVGMLPNTLNILENLNLVFVLFLILILILYTIRQISLKKGTILSANTWGCGYKWGTPRMQYTGSSFTSNIRSLFGRLLKRDEQLTKPQGLFPTEGRFSWQGKDRIEEVGVRPLLSGTRRFLQWFNWIQQGNLQIYLLYALLFLMVVIIFAVRG